MTQDDPPDERTASRDEPGRSGREPDAEPLELVGAYDEVGGRPAFVVADIDRDEAWLSVADGAECDLGEWR